MSPDDERIRSGALSRICTDSYQRDAEFVMPSNHCHAYYEIYYLEQGACRFFLGDTMLDLHSGDLLLIPPQLLHYTRYLYGSCRRSTLYFRREDADDAVVKLLPGGCAKVEGFSVLHKKLHGAVPGYRFSINRQA